MGGSAWSGRGRRWGLRSELGGAAAMAYDDGELGPWLRQPWLSTGRQGEHRVACASDAGAAWAQAGGWRAACRAGGQRAHRGGGEEASLRRFGNGQRGLGKRIRTPARRARIAGVATRGVVGAGSWYGQRTGKNRGAQCPFLKHFDPILTIQNSKFHIET